ncbi:MAG: hypothetical protein R3D45_10700 [Rhizobiaceae bacterium]
MARSFGGFAVDTALGLFGVALAAGSLYFPWYVYRHSDRFQPPRIEYSGNTELYGEPEDRTGVLWLQAQLPQGTILDPIETGTVDKPQEEETAGEARGEPTRSAAYRLVFVANGRALVRDDTGVFVVTPNSTLPDGQRVTEFRSVDDQWELLTSGNEIVAGDN